MTLSAHLEMWERKGFCTDNCEASTSCFNSVCRRIHQQIYSNLHPCILQQLTVIQSVSTSCKSLLNETLMFLSLIILSLSSNHFVFFLSSTYKYQLGVFMPNFVQQNGFSAALRVWGDDTINICPVDDFIRWWILIVVKRLNLVLISLGL